VFAPVGRRLALLNAIVVLAVIAATGTLTFLLLRQSLDREADQALAERAGVARESWQNVFEAGRPLSTASPRSGADDGEHKEKDDESEDHDEEARDLVESGDILLFAVDQEGRLLASARGLTMPSLPEPTSVAVALAGTVDTRSIRIDGDTVRVYTAPVWHDGRILGAVQAARNEREHQAELRLIEMMSLAGIGLGVLIAVPAGLFLAQRAMRPIEAAFSRQRAFVADASHELRTPLTLIRATTELIRRLPDASPAVREELGGILDEVDATNRLVDDLLLLARLDSDELPLRREASDLGGVVRAAAEPLTPQAEAKRLALTIDAPTGMIVEVDADRIRQVVRNLLANALAYTPAGGTVHVTVERKGARGAVSVRDTGVGIPLADQARIFDRFYRADRARARSSGGTGLGLAIARALVHAHHGEIGIGSQPGHGTTVWFSVALAPNP
jgi:signal transduction histidine kinase